MVAQSLLLYKCNKTIIKIIQVKAVGKIKGPIFQSLFSYLLETGMRGFRRAAATLHPSAPIALSHVCNFGDDVRAPEKRGGLRMP